MTSSHQIYKAFVSSTFEDLKEHRAHVIRSLRRAGFFVDPMEDWVADSDEPKRFSQDRLNGCHLCVLLVAFRRGYVPDGETRSITQLEYDAAVKQGVDILPFLLDENAPWPRKFDERRFNESGQQDDRTEIARWRDHHGKNHGREVFTLDPHSIDLTGSLSRWLAKKNGGQAGLEKIKRIDWLDGKSPYRGLQWFNHEYAPLFFGRDREVDELITKMSEPGGRTVLVIGGSGSGKSSVVAAGVWKALIEEGRLPGSSHWKWHRIQPSDGDTPSDVLARGLKEAFQLCVQPQGATTGVILRELLSQHLSPGQEFVLFVDQMEELFTSGFKESDIKDFLGQLITTAQDPTNRLRIVATMQSEFSGKLEAYEFRLRLDNGLYRYHLRPVLPRMLQEMIEKPAEATGYTFEQGVIDRIFTDTGKEPGNLALVEYALKQLFERRKGRKFTVEAYEAIGGVVGAIATKANEVLSGLPAEVRGAFDAVFAELVHLDRERLPTHRRAAVSTFSSNHAARQLIDALAGQECRVLVTSGTGQEAIVEVAHEKLFTAWPELKKWIDESGPALRDIEHAEEEAWRWQKGGDNPQELWLGSRAKKLFTAIERFGKSPSAELERFLRPQEVLIAKLNEEPSHQKRLLIGQKLAEFSDPRPGVSVKNGVPSIVWVEIPGGDVKLAESDHVFEVKPFRIAKYPVTNVQFKAFLSAVDGYRDQTWWTNIEQSGQVDSPRWADDNSPRETVSWFEAIAFCRWLSAKTKTNIRLPAEWEWQQAATGGDPTNEYPWRGEWETARCNSAESRLDRTMAVGMYLCGATQQGLMDMAGNVCEWCSNEYRNPARPEAMSIENDKGSGRVIRGGSWANFPGGLRVSFRSRYRAGSRSDSLGFRLVQDIEP